MRVPAAIDPPSVDRMDVAELRELLSARGPAAARRGRADRLDRRRGAHRLAAARRGALRRPGRRGARARRACARRRSPSSATSPRRMLFTPDGLEQATRLRVAALHAGPLRRGGGGCRGRPGLRHRRRRDGVRRARPRRSSRSSATSSPPPSPRYNLAPFPSAQVELGDAESTDLAAVGGVWLDPARRAGGQRLDDPAEWSPHLDWAFGIAARPADRHQARAGPRPRPHPGRLRGAVGVGRSRGGRAGALVRRGRPPRHRSRRAGAERRRQRGAHRRGGQRRRGGRAAGTLPARTGWRRHPGPPDRRSRAQARRPHDRPDDRLDHLRRRRRRPRSGRRSRWSSGSRST